MKLTRNFSLSELTCRDGTPVPDEHLPNAKLVCERAQALRDLVGAVLLITSGYRTETHNRKVGGAKASLHLTASALDISDKGTGFSAHQLGRLYQGLITLGVVPDGGLGIYDSWIHLDLGKPRRWYK